MMRLGDRRSWQYLHSKKSNFSFADGHAETHAWKDSTTLFVFEKQIVDAMNYPYGPNEGTDLTWFVIASPRRNPTRVEGHAPGLQVGTSRQ